MLQELASVLTPSAVPATNSAPRILRVLGTQASTFVQSSQCPLQGCTLSSTAICPLVYRRVGRSRGQRQGGLLGGSQRILSVPPSASLVVLRRACNGSIVSATATQRCAPSCTPSDASGSGTPSPSPPLSAGLTTPLPMWSTFLLATVALLLAGLVQQYSF